MAHFAKLNDDNVVLEVHVVHNSVAPNEAEGVAFLTNWSGGYKNWKQCSYNGNFRKQYPGSGYTYDPGADVFIAPQPYPSWSLDHNYDWQAPTPMPETGIWSWDENTKKWVEIK